MVDVGERVLAASGIRECQEGMQVTTHSPAIDQHRKTLTQLLLTDHPVPCQREATTSDCQLERLGRQFNVIDEQRKTLIWPTTPSQLTDQSSTACESPKTGDSSPFDDSSPVIAVDHSACILCDRCIRACDDVQSNHIIGRTGKGLTATIAFDLNLPMGQSNCVSCGECVSECPTGALTNKDITLPVVELETLTRTDTVCPYCGVGCATHVYTQDNQIVRTEGRESPVNDGRLCVKGRYGWDYSFHPQRLTRPLITARGCATLRRSPH